jgi:hypothetical protein
MASPLRWHLPAPSQREIQCVRLVWWMLLSLALGWLASVGWDVFTGRAPTWHGALALLLVGGWAWVTGPLVRSVSDLAPLCLTWREADRDHAAAWIDASERPVSVRPLVDLGVGVWVRYTESDGVEASGVRWVPASALSTEVRWRLFQQRHQAVASSGFLSDETSKLPSLATRTANAPQSLSRQPFRAHGRRQA